MLRSSAEIKTDEYPCTETLLIPREVPDEGCWTSPGSGGRLVAASNRTGRPPIPDPERAHPRKRPRNIDWRQSVVSTVTGQEVRGRNGCLGVMTVGKKR